MPRRYYRSYGDSDSKNAEGMILFLLSLTFLTALVVSMVTFAVHIKRELEASATRQEPEIPDVVWPNATRSDIHADANHTVEHKRTTVVAKTTSKAARRRNMRRRGHDERRQPREHAEGKPADDGAPDQRPREDSNTNIPQANDHNAENIETTPPTTTTPTTTTKESTKTAPITTSRTSSTKTSTTTPAATKPARTKPPARTTVTTATTTPSTSPTTTSPTSASSKSPTTPTTKPADDATPNASSTIRWTRAIIRALTVEKLTSPTQPTTPRLTRKIIAAKGVVPGRDSKKTRAEDGAEAGTPLLMEAPMVGPAIDGGRPPATAVGSFRRPEAGTSVTAKERLESSPPEKTSKISPTSSSRPAPSPKRDSTFTSVREPRTSHQP
ncbi:hypothetical protein MTO96_018838 [Rhipicephalus appendiculatus]